MKIIGCHFHPSYQQIAVLDLVTEEMVEKALSHERKDKVRVVYAELEVPGKCSKKCVLTESTSL